MDEKAIIKRFIADKNTSAIIKAHIREYFLKQRKGYDVQTLAASTLAVWYLDEAFKSFENLAKQEDEKKYTLNNPGV